MTDIPLNANKKICPKCNKKFELTDYYMHLQEELLLLTVDNNKLLNDIKEALLLSNEYINGDNVDDESVLDNTSDDELKKMLGYENKPTDPEVIETVKGYIDKAEASYPETQTEKETTDFNL